MSKAALLSLGVIFAVGAARAQLPDGVVIDSVTVSAPRPLAGAGATVTRLDSSALRYNLSKSLADVLGQSTSLFVKSHGRGTMASVSVRGTSPSHTRLLWNGMEISSPMLGSADYSLIPSYFIDNAALIRGAASAGTAGGGFGGVVALSSAPPVGAGWGLQFIQGAGSYLTFDSFLRISWAGPRLRLSTRVGRGSSRNDFRYVNYDKNPGDDGSYPVERNRNASFRDFHILQDVYWTPRGRSHIDASVWLVDSRRDIPLASVNYRDADSSLSRQSETTLRAVAGWRRASGAWELSARGGYSVSRLGYLRLEDAGNGERNPVSDSRNDMQTGFGRFAAGWYPAHNLLLTASLTAYLHSVSSLDAVSGQGYDALRAETSLKSGVRWQPWRVLALGGEVRAETCASRLTPPIWSAFAEFLVWNAADLRLKLSGGRNYRHPSLNDLYYSPGGNPGLRPESSRSCEAALEGGASWGAVSFRGSVAAYDSRIDDWILWLYGGSNGGAVWSPRNVKKVHAYGAEFAGKISAGLGRGWSMALDGSWSWTPAVNRGAPIGENDASTGKQLPYTPLYSSSLTAKLAWRSVSVIYKFSHYSERFTTSSNDYGYSFGAISPYYMSDVAVEKTFSPRWGGVSVQFCVNNLLDEEYVSVLSRPMPRINFGLFVGITPKW